MATKMAKIMEETKIIPIRIMEKLIMETVLIIALKITALTVGTIVLFQIKMIKTLLILIKQMEMVMEIMKTIQTALIIQILLMVL